jgi:hypothetical protein
MVEVISDLKLILYKVSFKSDITKKLSSKQK